MKYQFEGEADNEDIKELKGAGDEHDFVPFVHSVFPFKKTEHN